MLREKGTTTASDCNSRTVIGFFEREILWSDPSNSGLAPPVLSPDPTASHTLRQISR